MMSRISSLDEKTRTAYRLSTDKRLMMRMEDSNKIKYMLQK
jgi:hypothetical protein